MTSTDDDLDIMLLSTSTSKQFVFNFVKSFSLAGAVQCLEEASPEAVEIANTIMDDIMIGYQSEDHLVQ
jgi:hypothetical protein